MKLVEVAGATDPGRVRRRNEDSFVCEPPLFVVADGMGGAQAGEIASRLAAGAFRDFHEADALDAEARLRSIIQEANRRIFSRAATDPHASGMGTTVTAALVTGGHVAVGHVGDSRAYLLRDGQLEQLTQDHSLVADLVRAGRLTPEEAEVHPQRSVITRALGTDAAVSVDSFTVEVRPGDVFLLCSDGLTTMIDRETMQRLVGERRSLQDAAGALVAAANAHGGEDNVTVVLFSLAESAEEEDTLSGLEGLRIPFPDGDDEVAVMAGPETDLTVVGLPTVSSREPRGRLARWLIVLLVVLALFAAVAGVALWGLSRAHFVGANASGRVTVYQGVPWDLFAGIKLYREVYVSTVRIDQLSSAERTELFDHDLMSEDAAIARIKPFEELIAIS